MKLYFPADPSASSAARELASQSGHWLLQSQRAITLSPKVAGQLSVVSGQLWATLGNSSGKGGRRFWRAAPLPRCVTLKDYFLNAGDALDVPPGAQLVIESAGRTQTAPAAFAWHVTPLPVPQIASTSVLQAATELGQALVQVARALRRLVGAVLAGRKPNQRLKTCQ